MKKISKIIHTNKGYYVKSQNGKNLGGPYKNKSQALKRLKQVEYYKKHDDENEVDDKKNTFSAQMRELHKKNDDIILFMKNFKKLFDKAIINNSEDPEHTVLMQIKIDASTPTRMVKLVQSSLTNDPAQAGKSISNVIHIITGKIPESDKKYFLNILRDKIINLNEFDISQIKGVDSTSLGRSLAFIKNVLSGYQPKYIKDVLLNIIRNL